MCVKVSGSSGAGERGCLSGQATCELLNVDTVSRVSAGDRFTWNRRAGILATNGIQEQKVAKVVADMDISLDGFVAGEGASPEVPLGEGGEGLIWYGDDVNKGDTDFEGAYGPVDAGVLRASMESEGAVVMGRRTFEVSVDAWGENPPIHKPCFVLSSRASPHIANAGGTSFTFVTGGPDEAIRLAKDAAGSRDVGVMGGARTIRSLLEAGLLDELRLHVVPVLLGRGMRLFEAELDSRVELEKVQALDGESAVHLFLRPRRRDVTPGPSGSF